MRPCPHSSGRIRTGFWGCRRIKWDWWYGGISASTPVDGAASGTYRVVRGGGWHYNAIYCGVSYRSYYYPVDWLNDVGFRVVCP
ncbi:hypothetical protein FACS1894110_17860 [Spirochaetia bacterium]|nr:hypothetical protein FACS1894110_17860 [Spirochaetia bacterium]